MNISKTEITQAYQTIRTQKPWQHPESSYIHHRVLPHATLAPWLNDSAFMSIYEKIKNHTLVDIYRCFELWTLAKQLDSVDGNVLEVGVWRGGTGAILASAVAAEKHRKVFLADTFTGVVKAGIKDTVYDGGEHADTSESIVSSLMNSLSLENTVILKGVFPEDTGSLASGKIALLHCDVDVYQSSKDIVEWCLPRMMLGSVLIFDDYGFFGCEGVTRLCDELRALSGFRFFYNLNGHALFVKLT